MKEQIAKWVLLAREDTGPLGRRCGRDGHRVALAAVAESSGGCIRSHGRLASRWV